MSLGLGHRIKRALVFLSIRLLDLLILASFLVWVFLWNIEESNWSPFDAFANSMWMFLGIVLVWVVTVAFVEAICVYFRQDTSMARLLRVFVTTLLIITIFPIALMLMLWFMGYSLSSDIQTMLYYVAIARGVIRAVLGRIAERRFIA